MCSEARHIFAVFPTGAPSSCHAVTPVTKALTRVSVDESLESWIEDIGGSLAAVEYTEALERACYHRARVFTLSLLVVLYRYEVVGRQQRTRDY